MSRTIRIFALVFIGLLSSGAVRAETFYLKDGSQIGGVIVGFDQGSFTIRTNFGPAVIPRDDIARIVFSKPQPARPGDPLVHNGFLFPLPWQRYEPLPRPAMDAYRYRGPQDGVSPRLEMGSLPKLVPPRPRQVSERVFTNNYINYSFRFTLYKPPTWKSYPALVRPDTDMIAALGTPDESTLLLIGWEYYEGDNRTYARLAGQALREIYEEFQLISEGETDIAGQKVYERRFSGLAEGRYWTGWSVYVSRGSEHYTFLGLTSSERFTQVQEIVLRRVLDSLRFYRYSPNEAQTARQR